MIDGWGISCEIAVRWRSLDLTGGKSTQVQVMAWYHQATRHHLGQCWFRSMLPYGTTRPHGVKYYSNWSLYRPAPIPIINSTNPENMSFRIPLPWITKISLKITYQRFHSNLTGATEFTSLLHQLSYNAWRPMVCGTNPYVFRHCCATL